MPTQKIIVPDYKQNVSWSQHIKRNAYFNSTVPWMRVNVIETYRSLNCLIPSNIAVSIVHLNSLTNIYEYLRILKNLNIHEYLRILKPKVTNIQSMNLLKLRLIIQFPVLCQLISVIRVNTCRCHSGVNL